MSRSGAKRKNAEFRWFARGRSSQNKPIPDRDVESVDKRRRALVDASFSERESGNFVFV